VEDVVETLAALILVARLGDYTITLEPAVAAIPPGPVVFEVMNEGFTRHALRVEGLDARTATLFMGGTEALPITFPEPGEYTLLCDIGFHAGAGMVLKLVVSSAG
jgi:plastocyanin